MFSGADSAEASSFDAPEEDSAAGASDAEAELSTMAPETAGVWVLTSGASLSKVTVGDHAQALSTWAATNGSASSAAELDPPAADAAAGVARDSSLVGTADGAAECLSGLLDISTADALELLSGVDFVRYDGEHVALIVTQPEAPAVGLDSADAPDAVSTAYLVPLDCRRENATTLLEPLPLAS